MDDKKKNNQPEDTSWLDEILQSSDIGEEITPNEQAMDANGLRDIGDMELEKIMQDVISDDWDLADIIEEAPPIPIHDNEYGDLSGEEGNLVFPSDPDENASGEAADEEEYMDTKRKVRPKRKDGYGLWGLPHIASTIIGLALILFVGLNLGRLVWVCATDVLAFGREDQVVYVTVSESDDLDSIAQKLYDTGLIRYKQLFKLYGQLSNAEKKVSPGTYKLNTLFDYHALVSGMNTNSSYRETVTVAIPEGFSCAQIFKLLEEKGVCPASELEEYAANNDFNDYWFLKDIQRGNKYALEGFLFPDTYEFYTNDTPKRVFIKFLNRFANVFTDEMQSYIEKLNKDLTAKMKKNGCSSEYIESHQMTVYKVITVASMIERESANSGENYSIASVIYNRLTNPDYPYLNIDATIIYALGGKTELTEADLQVDSPYNTYKYKGLPPGAISNPGLLSIQAALSPAKTDFYYYALDPAKTEHHFSKTLKEHQAFLDSLKG